ncbi:MAG TPA: glycosyl hydrolase family 18 [Clostridia bacterium]|nr:glycosyl hydrolase family 18 [Clostridia bacterium]
MVIKLNLKKIIFWFFIIILVLWVFTPRNKLAFYGYYCEEEGELASSFSSAFLHASVLQGVAFFWYQCLENGEIAVQGEVDLDMLKYLQAKGLKSYAVFHNLQEGQFNSAAVEKILKDDSVSEKLIANMVKIVLEQNFTGVNLDLENIPPELRNDLSDFVARLKSQLQAHGRQLSIAVPAKEEDDLNSRWSGAFDYAALAKQADYLVIMAYEEHGFTTVPGPIASLPWVEEVIKYSLSQVPKEKLVLGIPVYGFLWNSENKPPRYFSYSQLKKIAKEQGVKSQWDNIAKAPYFSYNEGKTTYWSWYEDKRSFSYKLGLARKYGLAGVAIWRLGMEDPNIWDRIKK